MIKKINAARMDVFDNDDHPLICINTKEIFLLIKKSSMIEVYKILSYN